MVSTMRCFPAAFVLSGFKDADIGPATAEPTGIQLELQLLSWLNLMIRLLVF